MQRQGSVTLNEIEREAIILNAVCHLIDDMLNRAMVVVARLEQYYISNRCAFAPVQHPLGRLLIDPQSQEGRDAAARPTATRWYRGRV